MQLQRLTTYLLRHRWYTTALVFFGTFAGVYATKMMSNLPIVVGLLGIGLAILLPFLGIVIAALVTIINGAAEGALVTMAATLPYIFAFLIPVGSTTDAPETLSFWVILGVGVAVSSNILTWVFAVMLKRKTSWSLILQIAALIGVLFISVIHLVYPDIGAWWGTQLHALNTYYTQIIGATNNTTAVSNVSLETQSEVIEIVKELINGFIVVLILIEAILQLMVARWWQSNVFNPGSVGRELRHIRLSKLAGVLFIVSFVFSYLGNRVVLDVMPILYVLFAAAGLSLTHYLFKLSSSPNTWFWVLVFYLIFIFSMPFSLMLMAIVGLFDIWMDTRKRVSKV